MSERTALTNEELEAVLRSVWEKSLPVLRQRVTVLEKAAQALRAGTLGDELRNEASEESHRLAGLLGTFGYPEGTDAGRLLELTFDPELEGGSAADMPQISEDTLAKVESSVELLRKIVGD
jgi:HPt (histidine-containing phosphotransfer) domain-containing protein